MSDIDADFNRDRCLFGAGGARYCTRYRKLQDIVRALEANYKEERSDRLKLQERVISLEAENAELKQRVKTWNVGANSSCVLLAEKERDELQVENAELKADLDAVINQQLDDVSVTIKELNARVRALEIK